MTSYKAKRLMPEGVDDIDKLRNLGRGRLSHLGDHVQSNTARASWAAEGLVAFSDCVGDGGEPLYEIVSDLLADLRHLCDATGVDFHDCLHRANGNYTAEIHGVL